MKKRFTLGKFRGLSELVGLSPFEGFGLERNEGSVVGRGSSGCGVHGQRPRGTHLELATFLLRGFAPGCRGRLVECFWFLVVLIVVSIFLSIGGQVVQFLLVMSYGKPRSRRCALRCGIHTAFHGAPCLRRDSNAGTPPVDNGGLWIGNHVRGDRLCFCFCTLLFPLPCSSSPRSVCVDDSVDTPSVVDWFEISEWAN